MRSKAQAIAVLTVSAVLGAWGLSWARVNVDVHVGVPLAPVPVPVAPALVIPSYPPPESLVLVPNTSVYFVPEVEAGLFVSGNSWWTCREGRWYRARSHGGPWRHVGVRAVPAPILHLPPNYRQAYTREEHVPYGQWKKHEVKWKYKEEWKREKHGRERHGHGRRED